MDLRVNLSSCVPATAFETSGAALSAADLVTLRDHPKVIGLAEFMNFPGVLAGDPGVLDKLAAFQDGHIDGHAPLLSGRDLNGYLAAAHPHRPRGDERGGSARKARQGHDRADPRRLGVEGPARAGRSARRTTPRSFMALCTDDRNPLDIAEEGHLDYMIRTLIALGRPRHCVYRAASWSAADAPSGCATAASSRRAGGPTSCCSTISTNAGSHSVIAGGRLVEDALFEARAPLAPVGLDSMKAERVSADDFRVPARAGRDAGDRRDGRADHHRAARACICLRAARLAEADLAQDAIKVAVVARHGKNRNIGRGFVHGFGLKRGAIASSVGHDSHNITVVGADDADMAAAVNRVIEMQGGFAVAAGGAVTAELALPVAGLMSLEPFETVREQAHARCGSAAKALGCTLPEPFLQVAFLPLPVIPHLKITDLGLFDVDRFELCRRAPASPLAGEAVRGAD